MSSTADLKRRIKRTLKNLARRVRSPRATARSITSDLRALGVRPGDTLLVHSSLSSLGYVPGGADEVIRGLLDAVGSEGTLAMPAHSWEAMEAGLREFDVRSTPCCVGAIPERFRLGPGVVRSLHPSHSLAAVGPAAAELVAGHESRPTPCGEGTPYLKLLENGGRILLLGVDLRSLTVFHTVEAIADLPYLMKPSPDVFEMVDERGARRRIEIRRHAAGVPRRFQPHEAFLSERGVLTVGRVGPARASLLDGRRFLEVMVETLRRDPRFLLEHAAESADRPEARTTVGAERPGEPE